MNIQTFLSKRLTLISTNTDVLDPFTFNATDIKIYKSLPLCNLKLMEVVLYFYFYYMRSLP